VSPKVLKWGVRVLMAAAFPGLITFVYFAELFQEMRRAFRFARSETMINIEDFKRLWRLYDGTAKSVEQWRNK
jgi:hypothetical protein